MPRSATATALTKWELVSREVTGDGLAKLFTRNLLNRLGTGTKVTANAVYGEAADGGGEEEEDEEDGDE